MFSRLIHCQTELSKNDEIPDDNVTLYVFRLPKGAILPKRLAYHKGRRLGGEDDGIPPSGHHSLNSLVSGVPVQEYIQNLKNLPFEAVPAVTIKYGQN
jgi:hypothetical protein